MNARKKSVDAGRSGLTKSKLLGAVGHVHNPFSMSHKDRAGEDYKLETNIGHLRTVTLQVEMSRAEAFIAAYNLVARFQKS